MRYEDQRRIMIDNHIVARGIKSEAILRAFQKVPRELFVPEELSRLSYQDCPLKIGHNQTISQPYIVALMLDMLSLEPADKVLEIGTGSGYQTALLAEIVNEVYTVERIPELLSSARYILDGMGYQNIFYRVGDGSKGWEKAFPVKKAFAKIVVSAAAPKVPPTLLDQLEDGGKLVIPTGSKWHQELLLITKDNDSFSEQKYGLCTFVPLIGKEGWEE